MASTLDGAFKSRVADPGAVLLSKPERLCLSSVCAETLCIPYRGLILIEAGFGILVEVPR